MKATYIVVIFVSGFVIGHILTVSALRKRYHNRINKLLKILQESYYETHKLLPEDKDMADGYNNAIAFSESVVKGLLNK